MKKESVCRCSHSSRGAGVILNIWQVKRGAFWKELSWRRIEEVLSLVFVMWSISVTRKGAYQPAWEKHKLWTRFTCQNVSLWCLWDVLEPQDIPAELEEEMWGFQGIHFQQELVTRWAGQCSGGWAELLWQCFVPRETDDISVLDFCGCFLSVIEVIKH